jgi:hypothetical protein
MTDARFSAILSFLQILLSSVIVGTFSSIISYQIQTREIEIKEQEANAKLIEQAIVEDTGIRLRLAQYFATVTRSDENRKRWLNYVSLIEDEAQRKLKERKELEEKVTNPKIDLASADKITARIEQIDRELSPVRMPERKLFPRVYIHISDPSQRANAERATAELASASIIAPGIELRATTLKGPELRYFKVAELQEAEEIRSLLSKVYPTINLKYIPGYEVGSKIRDRHYELWVPR